MSARAKYRKTSKHTVLRDFFGLLDEKPKNLLQFSMNKEADAGEHSSLLAEIIELVREVCAANRCLGGASLLGDLVVKKRIEMMPPFTRLVRVCPVGMP